MPKFALIAADEAQAVHAEVGHDVVDDTYQVLLTLGHSEFEARKMLDIPLSKNKKFKDVDALLQAVYEQANASD